MVNLIITLVRFIIAVILTIFLVILFPLEILIRLFFTIIVSVFSRTKAESAWDDFPLVFSGLSSLWEWVSAYD
jgi:hypothetical protein